jgi:glycosyltransferase involved in cell wall biosynthesis
VARPLNRRILVVTADTVGERMAGPAIRAVNLARELARREFQVTVASPDESQAELDGVTRARLDKHDARNTVALARQHDAVVAQWLPPAAMVALAGSETRVVYDLYDPAPHEVLASAHQHQREDHDRLQLTRIRLKTETALRAGDAFICASERQRDLWLGALGALGRLDHEEHRRDPSFRSLIDVVPFGIDAEPPADGAPAMRGVLPRVDERSQVVVWGGGLWNWLDPLTVIRAVAELARTREDVRLVFLGLRRPDAKVADTTMAERAVALADELEVHGTTVLFNDAWVPYERRGAWLAESDLGVSAHFDTLEARFAFRTRLLDYLWAGLPIVTTNGDVLGDLVEQEHLGGTLPAEDVSAWVAKLGELLGDEAARDAARARVAIVRSRFEWSRVVEPLTRLLEEPGRRVELPRRARLAGIREHYFIARMLILQRGVTGTLTTAWKQKTPRSRSSNLTCRD